MEIYLANPRGFCAGVDRAIAIVEKTLELYGAPIYVRHEVVHNRHVVNALRQKGAVFVEELDEVPAGSTVIFSAHGVSRQVREKARERGLSVFDATCPLVTKVHLEVQQMRKKGYEVVMVGHRGHPEVEGTLGQADSGIYLVETQEDIETLQVMHPDKLAYVTQTTLSVDDAQKRIDCLKKRFPDIMGPKKEDICYATQNRQNAVKQIALQCSAMLIIGSDNSSNSRRLQEVASRSGISSWLIDSVEDIDPKWLEGHSRVGISAGASAPEELAQAVVDKLKKIGAKKIINAVTISEDVSFVLPGSLVARAE